MKGWINISEVLTDMERIGAGGRLHAFSIAWVRVGNSCNGKRGSVKRVQQAAKFTKPQKQHTNASPGNNYSFKAHNTIPIQDIKNDQLLTPKFTHIIEYNGKKVKHWG